MKTQGYRCIVYSENAMCRLRCPLHNHIPEWISLARENKFIEAAECCHQTNPLPEIYLRVCPQDRLCKSGCTLVEVRSAVTIGYVECYIIDKTF